MSSTNTSSINGDVDASLASLRRAVSVLDPREIPLPEVTRLWKALGDVRRSAGNGQTLLAARVAEAREWAQSGYATPEEWMAATSGSSVGEAREQVTTSDRLGNGLDETAERMRQGRLSPQQAGIVADAAAVNPDAERDLCDRAERDSNKNLADEARRRKAQKTSAEDRARRHHRERAARRYQDRDDKSHFHVEGPASRMAAFFKQWEQETDRQYRAATKAGRREGREAYAFEAFMAVVANGSASEAGSSATKPRPKHLAMIRIDLSALVRGHAEGDELCEIAGFGAISVSEARALLGDSILKLVCTNGVDVVNLTHLGRGPTTAQELAVLWASQTCQVLGCYRTHTQYDHRVEFVESQHTRVDELDLLCVHHHQLKTFKGYALVAGAGKRRFVRPGDPDHPTRPGPSEDGQGVGSPTYARDEPGQEPREPREPREPTDDAATGAARSTAAPRSGRPRSATPRPEAPPGSSREAGRASPSERAARLAAHAGGRRRRSAGQVDLFGVAE